MAIVVRCRRDGQTRATRDHFVRIVFSVKVTSSRLLKEKDEKGMSLLLVLTMKKDDGEDGGKRR